jgi:L,D-transpeptidase ErfK/SrfK
VVPPGPDNPLGKFKFTLGWPTYLIHGTNKPYGVGLRASHGCIRLYPEDVEQLYGMMKVGTQVTVVNQPFVLGWHQDQLVLQTYDLQEDDERDWEKSRVKLLSKALSREAQQQLEARQQSIDWQRVDHIAHDPRGLVLSVSQVEQSEVAVIAAALRVENRVPDGSNWDGAGDPARDAENEVQEMVVEERQARALRLFFAAWHSSRNGFASCSRRLRASRRKPRVPHPSRSCARPRPGRHGRPGKQVP